MFKKILSLLLVLSFILCSAPFSVTAEGTESTEWEYEPYGEGIAVTKYNGDDTDVFVPAEIDGYSVIKIADGTFKDNDRINSVALALSVTEIGDEAFYDADNLVCIVTTESLTSIGVSAFYGCDTMNSLILYDNVNYIGTDAFGACPALRVWCNDGSYAHGYVVDNAIPYTVMTDNAVPETYTEGEVTYYLYNGQAFVIGCNADVTEVTVPAEVKGYPVTEIHGAFKNVTTLTTVTLPEGLKKIADEAFMGCSSLAQVNIPETVTYIGSYAFSSIGEADIYIPDSVTIIDAYAFRYAKITSVRISNSVTEIEYATFQECRKLKSVDMGNSVTYVGYYAFQRCDAMTELILSPALEQIDNYAFNSCHSLESVVLPEGLKHLMYYSFGYCKGLKSVVIPGTVEGIGNNAFDSCSELTEVILGEGVYSVMYQAFNGCSKLETVRMPKDIEYFTEGSFPSTTFLFVYEDSNAHKIAKDNNLLYVIYDGTDPVFPVIDGVTYCIIEDHAIAFKSEKNQTELDIPAEVDGYPVTELRGCFANTSSLKKVTIPDSVTKIDDSTFSGCYNLSEITMSANTEHIGSSAFYNCSSLISIKLPEGLEYIGGNAFYGCNSLVSIEMPDSVATLGDSAFTRCGALKSVTLSKNITRIGMSVFNSCSSLESIYLSDNVTYIGQYAFAYCTSLKELRLPENSDGVFLNSYSFYNCSDLTEITVPGCIGNIYNYAFASCYSLSKVVLEEGIYQISSNAFNGCSSLNTLAIPESATIISSSAVPQSCVLIVYEGSYGQSFAEEYNYMYVINDGNTNIEVITRDGITYFIYNGEAIAVSFDGSLTEVTVPAYIDEYPVVELRGTFANARNLTSVTLSEGLKIINDSTFSGCDSLTSITIPDSVEYIGSYAFYNTAFAEIDMPDSLTYLGDNAFYNSMIESIVIPDGVTEIDDNTFYNCDYLVSIDIGKGVTRIGQSAFARCDKLETAVMHDGLKRIETYAFTGCKKLTGVVLPESLEHIGEQAFYNCQSLKEINIPGNVYNVYNSAFEDCGIERVTIGEGVYQLSTRVFAGCDSIKTVLIPDSIKFLSDDAFPAHVIHLVYEGSTALEFCQKYGMLYYVIRNTGNPDIMYGTELLGNVKYTSSKNAAEVKVELIYTDGVIKDTVYTDSEGNYSFPYVEVGRYTLRAAKGDNTYTTSITVTRLGAFDVVMTGDTDLVLKNGFSVSGNVSEDVTKITITDTEGNIISSVIPEDGSFSFDNISTGDYILRIENEFGTELKEITVSGGDLTDIYVEGTAQPCGTVTGYTYVENRDGTVKLRPYALIGLSRLSDRMNVASLYSDENGCFSIEGIPEGTYILSCSANEYRPTGLGYSKVYNLRAYTIVEVTADSVCNAGAMTMLEAENDMSNIRGTVYRDGKTVEAEVILYARNGREFARYTTLSNGKYHFGYVGEGVFTIRATTADGGVGYATVVISSGNVYGDNTIEIEKNVKITNIEKAFFDEIPTCTTVAEAEAYRERVSREKAIYDSLTDSERVYLSEDYITKLEAMCTLLCGCEFTSAEGFTVTMNGLIATSEDIASGKAISFELSSSEIDAPAIDNDGINTYDEFVAQEILDAAENKTILKYYDISLTKTTDGTVTDITDISKETSAAGKLRITLDIPEEYRGYKHYFILHEHKGEVNVIADIDTDPNTVTVEVDKFSTFVLTATNRNVYEVPTLDTEITANNYTVTFTNASDISHIRYASGVHESASSIRNAEDCVNLDASTIAKYTVDGNIIYNIPRGGYYTVWVRMIDGTTYLKTMDVTHFTPYVSTYGVKITLHNIYDAKDFFIAKGEFNSYNEIKANGYIVRVTEGKLADKHDYTYTVSEAGMHTILVRYNDGSEYIFHEELTVDEPVFTTNGLQVTVSNIPDVKVIRTAYGEYYTPGETKRAPGARNFSNKSVIKDAEEYMLQYREEGRVTIIVEYNNGYVKVFHYDVVKKTPAMEQNGNTVTFGDLDGMVMVRYAEGIYATSGEIKKAQGSKVIKPEAIVDGKISVTLEKGTYTFCVQYDDESYNYYKIVIA